MMDMEDFDNSSSLHNPPATSFRSSQSKRRSADFQDKPLTDLSLISHDVHQFILTLSDIQDKPTASIPPDDVPDAVTTFPKKMDAMLHSYNSGDSGRKLGNVPEDDAIFLESVRQMAKLTNTLREFQNVDTLLNQMAAALERTLVFLEEEFRTLLEDSRNGDAGGGGPDSRKNIHKHSSFDSKNQHHHHHHHHHDHSNSVKSTGDDYPSYPPETVAKLGVIASTMVAAGHEAECSQVYTFSRRTAIRNFMVKQGFEVEVNMDEVVKMQWDSLEKVISRWINVVKKCSEIIFPAEKHLVESVFSDAPKVRWNLLGNIVSIVVIQLLDFADASAMAKKSAEKLFRYLDMYEALQNLIKAIGVESYSDEVMAEVTSAADRIAEASAAIFCDLENSIKNDSAKNPVPGGAVHPLTRYVMNYLKYACEYKDSLQKIFEKQAAAKTSKKNEGNQESQESSSSSSSSSEATSDHSVSEDREGGGGGAFREQVHMVMELLDGNLEEKSKQYKDPSLRNIFLMNNWRYILQKVKDSRESREVIGDTWCRKRSSIVRQYHKNYQRETWNRVLNCLNQEGLIGGNGKVANKSLLKERLKTFAGMVEEIHKAQSGWVVSDEQLQSELRISVSAVVIPAYRSFIGRFKNCMSEKQVDKYIKHQPEEVEAMIEGLFEGHASTTTPPPIKNNKSS